MIARARTLECSKNLRQIGMASMLYAADNQMNLPGTVHQRGSSWTVSLSEILRPYSREILDFKCPDDSHNSRARTYALNDFLTKNPFGADHLDYSILAKIPRPEATFMFAETAAGHSGDHFHFAPYHGGRISPAAFERQVAAGMHGQKANYLFADGHVESLSRQQTFTRLARVGGGFVDPSGN